MMMSSIANDGEIKMLPKTWANTQDLLMCLNVYICPSYFNKLLNICKTFDMNIWGGEKEISLYFVISCFPISIFHNFIAHLICFEVQKF